MWEEEERVPDKGKGAGWGALRQTGAGVQEPAESRKSGWGGARAAGEQLESEEKAQALSSQLCGRS